MRIAFVFIAFAALAVLCGSAVAQGGWYTSNYHTVNTELCDEFDDCEKLACKTVCDSCKDHCDLRFGYPIKFSCNNPPRTMDATDVCENWYAQSYSVKFSPSSAGKITATAVGAVALAVILLV